MNRDRLAAVTLAASLLAACTLPACGAPPDKVAAPSSVAPSTKVAPEPDDVVIVNAGAARTFAGHFRKGDRVRIDVLDTAWTHEPGATLHDARGVPGKRCESTPDGPCIGGDAPLLGLVLLTAGAVPEGANKDTACMSVQRLHVPDGAELTVPVDSEIALGPNDWEDGLADNSGVLTVLVERSSGKSTPVAERVEIHVPSTSKATLAGRFRAGEYVKIHVLGGRWSNDPATPPVGAAGDPARPCGAVGHVCVGGEGKPLMGLVLMMSCFSITESMMPLQRIERAFIPAGTEIVLATDADLYLAPNDRELDLPDNAGSARVRVRRVAP